MRLMLLIFYFFISNPAFSCQSEEEAVSLAIKDIYADEDVLNYICPEEKCSEQYFNDRIEISRVNLSVDPKVMVSALILEPKQKFRQYFTAVFLKRSCNYYMAFYPDVSMSGLSMLNNGRGNVRSLLAVEYATGGEKKLIEYYFDARKMNYTQIKKRELKK